MFRHKIHHDGWASAMAPTFVTTPTREQHVSYAEKLRQAEALRAQVVAHIDAGGPYVVLPVYPVAQVSA